MKAFLSYARTDADDASSVGAALEAAGHEVWVDTEVIVGGEQWRRIIVERIKACDVLIVLLSAESMSSPNVAAEVQLAADAGKRIVPVRLNDVEIDGELAYLLVGLHRIDMFPDRLRAQAAILAALDPSTTEPQGQVLGNRDPAPGDEVESGVPARDRGVTTVMVVGAGLVVGTVAVIAAIGFGGRGEGDGDDATVAADPTSAEASEIGQFCTEAQGGNRPLLGADLQGCDLDNADLSGLDLSSTNLTDASLRGADLSGSAMIRSDLRGADLADATVTGAHLYRVELAGAQGLDGIDWSHTLVERSVCDDGQPCLFDDAVMINSSLVTCSPAAYAEGAPIAGAALGMPLLWQDEDEDCLHDEYERENGILLGNPDTDDDGLVDSIDGHGGDETPLSLYEQIRALG